MAPPERVQSFVQTGAGFSPQETEHYDQVSEDEVELSASLAGSDEGQLPTHRNRRRICLIGRQYVL